jgi:hypothetical protein
MPFPDYQRRTQNTDMEPEPVAVRSVKDIQAGGRRWPEDVLGQNLRENQQVFIMVLTPGREPDEETRRRARAALDETFRKTGAYAQEHGITDAEIDAAIEEAMGHVRPGTD